MCRRRSLPQVFVGVAAALYACAGADRGTDGKSALVETSQEPAGAHCSKGGVAISAGQDLDADGKLDPNEVSATSYVCDAAASQPTLVTTFQEPPGQNCPTGGVGVQSGIDLDGDQVLDVEEVTTTAYICNGVDGNDGLSTLASVMAEAAGGNCLYGGQAIRTGVDDNRNGVLDVAEVDNTSYVCSGAPGADGQPGLTALFRSEDEAAGSNCSYGGRALLSGLDTNGSGYLDTPEVTGVSYVCNGAPATPVHATLFTSDVEPAGANCAAGGVFIAHGLDLDDDGVLAPGEVEAERYVCHGTSAGASVTPSALVEVSPSFYGALNAIWRYGNSNAGFAVGPNGLIMQLASSRWEEMVHPYASTLRGVWGTALENVYAVGADGVILHFDGSRWRPVDSGVTVTLNAIHGTGADDIFVVGDGGTILHWDGITWTQQDSGTTGNLLGVVTIADLQVAVGAGGTVLSRGIDGLWTPRDSGTSYDLTGVSATSTTNIWVVGWGVNTNTSLDETVVLTGGLTTLAVDATTPVAADAGRLTAITDTGTLTVVGSRSGSPTSPLAMMYTGGAWTEMTLPVSTLRLRGISRGWSVGGSRDDVSGLVMGVSFVMNAVTSWEIGLGCQRAGAVQGEVVRAGYDLDGDGVLERDEVTSLRYACDAGGVDNLVVTTPEPGGDNCQRGGIKTEIGLDDNGDGLLDPAEVDDTSYLCHGGGLPAFRTSTAQWGGVCAHGGVKVQMGRDADADGLLSDAEVDQTQYLCNRFLLEVATGPTHSCGLESDGTVRCWGKNQYGQLGDGTLDNSPVPVAVDGLTAVVDITAGGNHSCAVRVDGTAWCWGDNSVWQLGIGNSPTSSLPAPVIVSGGQPLSGVVEIAAGELHTCARLADATLRCWGDNTQGQLGIGTIALRTQPVTVLNPTGAPLTAITSLRAGRQHTCALRQGNDAYCWGDNDDHQINTNIGDVLRAQLVASGILRVAPGEFHTCVLDLADVTRCWGRNDAGQLGDGTQTNSSGTTVSGLSGVVDITAGGQHTCAVLADGSARCWGYNYWGEVGNGSYGDYELLPVIVDSLVGVVGIAGGESHTCAWLSDGSARCWGANESGQLGNWESRSLAEVRQPVAVNWDGP